jgi:hypothetical protein
MASLHKVHTKSAKRRNEFHYDDAKGESVHVNTAFETDYPFMAKGPGLIVCNLRPPGLTPEDVKRLYRIFKVRSYISRLLLICNAMLIY